jgi:hypothetical protein
MLSQEVHCNLGGGMGGSKGCFHENKT